MGIGLMLLPVCYGMSLALWALLHPFKNIPEGSYYFFIGISTYFVFEWACFRPIRTYVFGHELTHALAAWMSGGRVKHFHVSKHGGSVSVTKTNVFVALAPYMIPLYSLIVIGIFYLVNWFYPLHAYWSWFLWLFGITVGFHMALTTYALRQGQPDLKAAGKFLSAILIYLGNVVSLILVLGMLFPQTVSWKTFLRLSGRNTLAAWRHVGEGSAWAYREATQNAVR